MSYTDNVPRGLMNRDAIRSLIQDRLNQHLHDSTIVRTTETRKCDHGAKGAACGQAQVSTEKTIVGAQLTDDVPLRIPHRRELQRGSYRENLSDSTGATFLRTEQRDEVLCSTRGVLCGNM